MTSIIPGKLFLSEGPPSRTLQVTAVEIESHRLLDVRVCYVDKETSKLQPTRKGIMLNRANFVAVADLFERCQNEIREWLGLTFVPQEVQSHAAKCANVPSGHQLSSVEWSVETGSSSAGPYSIKFQGPIAHICFNERHPWVADQCAESMDARLAAVAEFIAATHLASLTVDADSDQRYQAVLAMQLEMDTSKVLYRLARGRGGKDGVATLKSTGT